MDDAMILQFHTADSAQLETAPAKPPDKTDSQKDNSLKFRGSAVQILGVMQCSSLEIDVFEVTNRQKSLEIPRQSEKILEIG